jgi:spore germination protein
MNPVKKRILIPLLLLVTIFQTGCWDQRIYEKIGFMLQMGIEEDPAGRFMYTAGMPVLSPEATKRTEIITTTANLMREGRDKVRNAAGKTVEGGKVQQILFSEGIAQKGINQFFEIFIRSAENPLLSNVIVVEGSPNELLMHSVDFADKPRPTFYINGLLESARKSSYVPETRITDFTVMTYARTIDPTTPLLSYNEKEIKVTGAAVFSGDKMVGKINPGEVGLLTGLMGKKRDISYIYQGDFSEKKENDIKRGIVILMKVKKRKIKIDINENKPTFNINLTFAGNISEYSGDLDLSKPEEQKQLEEEIGDSISKDCSRLLKYFVSIDSDPIGFGEELRSKHNQYWKSIKWKDLYKEAAFNVNTKIQVEFYGAIATTEQ